MLSQYFSVRTLYFAQPDTDLAAQTVEMYKKGVHTILVLSLIHI